LKKARGSVKVAIIMIKAKVDYHQALELLKRADGFVRKAIEKRLKGKGISNGIHSVKYFVSGHISPFSSFPIWVLP